MRTSMRRPTENNSVFESLTGETISITSQANEAIEAIRCASGSKQPLPKDRIVQKLASVGYPDIESRKRDFSAVLICLREAGEDLAKSNPGAAMTYVVFAAHIRRQLTIEHRNLTLPGHAVTMRLIEAGEFGA